MTITNDYHSPIGFKLTADGVQYNLWKQIMDANIKTWIYNTCDHHLLQSVFQQNCSALELVARIDEFFANNKRSRSFQIRQMFLSVEKGDMSVTDFCYTLRNLSHVVNEVDSESPVSETELVMQILRKLPCSYESVVDVITNTKPFPNFNQAKDMLIGHELRETYAKRVFETPQNGKRDVGSEGGDGNEFADNERGEQGQKRNTNGQRPPTSSHGQPPLAAFLPPPAAGFSGQPQFPPNVPPFTTQAQQFGPAFSPYHDQNFGSQSYQFGKQYGQQDNLFNQFGQYQFWQPSPGACSPYGSQFAEYSSGQLTSARTDLSSDISPMPLWPPNADPKYNMDTGMTSHISDKSKKIMNGNTSFDQLTSQSTHLSSDISPMPLRPPNADSKYNMDTGTTSHISDKSKKIMNGDSDALSITQDPMKLTFQGHIVYSRTFSEVENATDELLKFVETKYKDGGRAVIGLDIEWKPSFRKGEKESKAAVLQICADSDNCHVMHILHSGFPQNLQNLLGDTTFLKVGVGITGDARKLFKDHNVSIEALQDLSRFANQKFGGKPKSWGLSSLVEKLTSKQVTKPKKIQLSNWEANPLSSKQLEYAATDAYASLFLFEVLNRLPDADTRLSDADTLTNEAVEAKAPSRRSKNAFRRMEKNRTYWAARGESVERTVEADEA